MSQARKTLSDARGAIDDLRSKSHSKTDFKEILQEKINRFTNATGIQVASDIRIYVPLADLIMEHSVYLVSEGLTNIARHAQARNAWIDVISNNDCIHIRIKDDGTGFNTEDIGKKPGHYGLLGMIERTRLINGTFNVSSGPEGTCFDIKIHHMKGDSL